MFSDTPFNYGRMFTTNDPSETQTIYFRPLHSVGYVPYNLRPRTLQVRKSVGYLFGVRCWPPFFGRTYVFKSKFQFQLAKAGARLRRLRRGGTAVRGPSLGQLKLKFEFENVHPSEERRQSAVGGRRRNTINMRLVSRTLQFPVPYNSLDL